jgi:hypothetical protein
MTLIIFEDYELEFYVNLDTFITFINSLSKWIHKTPRTLGGRPGGFLFLKDFYFFFKKTFFKF